MHGFTQKALAALLGLCMASAMAAPHDPAFNAFMQLTVGNKTTVSFAGNGTPLVASSAPLGQPAIGQFGVSRTAQGVFMESIGGARIPGTNSTIPVKGKLALSGQVIGKTLSRALLVYAAWEVGSALYDIWSDAGLSLDRSTGQVRAFGPSTDFTLFDAQQAQALPLLTSDQYLFTYNSRGDGLCQPGSPLASGPARFGGLIVWRRPTNQRSGNSGKNFERLVADCWSVGIAVWEKGFESTPAPPGLSQPLTTQQVEYHIAQQSSWSNDRITHAIRDALRLPGVAPEIVPDLKPAPLEVTFPSGTPVVEVGEPETRTTTRILPNGDVEEITRTTTRRARTTTTEPAIRWDEETTTRRVVRAPDGTVISDETTEQETAPQTDQSITCGLPGTPPCKIDEEGTPAPPEDDGESVFDFLIPSCLKSDWKFCIPELPDINWAFTLPKRCSPIPLPGFERWGLGSIDMCRYQPMIHDIMSMLWAAAGLFGAVSIVRRGSRSEGS